MDGKDLANPTRNGQDQAPASIPPLRLNHRSSNQPLALPTWKQNHQNRRPGHLLLSEVDLPTHLHTSPPFPPQKRPLLWSHRLTLGARGHLTPGSLPPDAANFI